MEPNLTSGPRAIIGITLFIWLGIGSFLGLILKSLSIILIPLYGLCPCQIASEGPLKHPVLLTLWGIFAGGVFLATALFGWLRNSKAAAVSFAVLFVVSIVFVVVRIAAALPDLH